MPPTPRKSKSKESALIPMAPKKLEPRSPEDLLDIFDTISKDAAWATAKSGSSQIEELWALALDDQDRIFTWKQLSYGTLVKTAFYPREIVRWALLQDAVGVILIHNHPSGNNRPSDADLQMNRQAKEALKLMNIRLLDNLIITAEGKFYSFQQSGLL